MTENENTRSNNGWARLLSEAEPIPELSDGEKGEILGAIKERHRNCQRNRRIARATALTCAFAAIAVLIINTLVTRDSSNLIKDNQAFYLALRGGTEGSTQANDLSNRRQNSTHDLHLLRDPGASQTLPYVAPPAARLHRIETLASSVLVAPPAKMFPLDFGKIVEVTIRQTNPRSPSRLNGQVDAVVGIEFTLDASSRLVAILNTEQPSVIAADCEFHAAVFDSEGILLGAANSMRKFKPDGAAAPSAVPESDRRIVLDFGVSDEYLRARYFSFVTNYPGAGAARPESNSLGQ